MEKSTPSCSSRYENLDEPRCLLTAAMLGARTGQENLAAMKPLLEFSAPLLDNRARFIDPFFQRFTLRPRTPPIALTETITKDYVFPTLYRDVRCAIGIFTCDRQAERGVLASPALRP